MRTKSVAGLSLMNKCIGSRRHLLKMLSGSRTCLPRESDSLTRRVVLRRGAAVAGAMARHQCHAQRHASQISRAAELLNQSALSAAAA